MNELSSPSPSVRDSGIEYLDHTVHAVAVGVRPIT